MKNIFWVLALCNLMLSACSESKLEKSDQQVEKEKTITNTASKNVFVVPEVPDSIQFANEWFSLTDLDLKERFDRELIVNNFWHSNTILYLKRANRWFPLMSEILKEEGIPEDMLYLAVIESGLTQATSPSGAKGFWQFMEPTARDYNLRVDHEVDERLNIEKSTRAACKYLKSAYQKFGTWFLAAASYNMGKGGVQSNLDRQGVDSYFDLSLNSETARYVFRILAVKEIMNNPKKFGFEIDAHQLYSPYKTRKVKVENSIGNLYEWSLEQGVTIKIVRKLNPWISGSELTLISNQTIEIELPKNNEQLSTFGG
ncbi:MAG: murein transglycosylase [Fluviicola sp.]|nr:MAG: murein transglycosylase [Fluviicola sp.]